MKKNGFLMIFLLVFAFVISAQDIVEKKGNVKIKKTYNLQKSYTTAQEELLVSESDINCSFFITSDPLPANFRIINAPRSDDNQVQFSGFDQMYIDAGSNQGLKEGDMFIIVARGPKFRSPFSKKKLGFYYLKKSLAKITCLYEDRSIITLDYTCNPVEIGDYVMPYTPEKTIWQKKLKYFLCRLPENALEGRVIYNESYMGLQRNIAGPGDYVGIELGSEMVEKGTFFLFYRKLRKDLPHLIIGSGIVVNSQKEVCTVKVLDIYTDIRAGDMAAVMSGINEIKQFDAEKTAPVEEKAKEEVKEKDKDKKGKKEEEAIVEKPEERMMSDLYFDFDSKAVPADAIPELEKVAGFISGKSEYVIILRGYCCSIGSDEYNLKLSQERVEAIKALLINQHKIDPTHIEIYYYGEKESLNDNSQESERKKNRLVKIEVVGK